MAFFNISKANERIQQLETDLAGLSAEKQSLTAKLDEAGTLIKAADEAKLALSNALEAEKKARTEDAARAGKDLEEAKASAAVEIKRVLASSGHTGVVQPAGGSAGPTDSKSKLEIYRGLTGAAKVKFWRENKAEIIKLGQEETKKAA